MLGLVVTFSGYSYSFAMQGQERMDVTCVVLEDEEGEPKIEMNKASRCNLKVVFADVVSFNWYPHMVYWKCVNMF